MAASPHTEFRVSWQRVGQARKRSLYQTRAAAVRCAERQASARDEMDWLPEPLPELTGPPVIEEREVGPWVASAATEDVRG